MVHRNPFGIEPIDLGFGNDKKKRNLTPTHKIWCWENKTL